MKTDEVVTAGLLSQHLRQQNQQMPIMVMQGKGKPTPIGTMTVIDGMIILADAAKPEPKASKRKAA